MLFYNTANPFTFAINSGGSLALNGIGIVNNSGSAQTFNVGNGTSSGTLEFQNAATAGNAVINTNGDGRTEFSGNSTGGTAQFTTVTGGVVDFSGSTGPAGNGQLTAGSIAGTGNYYLGANQLTVGSNNLSTSVSGIISDCGVGGQCSGNANGSTGGALVKIGSGTLTLSGANTYTGGTTLTAGTLNVGVNSVYTTSGVPSSGIVSSAIGTGTLLFNGGTLQAGGVNFSIANAGQITNNGGTIDANGQTFTLAGAIANNPTSPTIGPLNIVNSNGTAGIVVLSGANTYSGATNIGVTGNTVTLAGGAASTFSPNSAVTVGANGTLDLGSLNQTVGALSGSGTVTSLTNPTSRSRRSHGRAHCRDPGNFNHFRRRNCRWSDTHPCCGRADRTDRCRRLAEAVWRQHLYRGDDDQRRCDARSRWRNTYD